MRYSLCGGTVLVNRKWDRCDIWSILHYYKHSRTKSCR